MTVSGVDLVRSRYNDSKSTAEQGELQQNFGDLEGAEEPARQEK